MNLNNIKCFIFDLDGTLYKGETKVDKVEEVFDLLDKKNKEYYFLTNDSAKDSKKIKEKLNKFNLDVEEEKIFTSGLATIMYINEIKPKAKVFIVGTKSLEEEFEKSGFYLVRDYDEIPDYVVVGLDKELTFEKICYACHYLFNGAEYLATHPDVTCVTDNGERIPDIGAIMKMIEATTNMRPTVIGKPEKYMMIELFKKYNLDRFKKEEILIIGDRLATDIKVGKAIGINTILVLSGDTTKDEALKSEIKADYIFDSIADIIENID